MNLPNLISLLRVPLALVLFIPNIGLRIAALCIALLTDGLDGYLARTLKLETRLGAILDPLTDKFFVIVALMICYQESTLEPWQVVAFFSRDIALFFLTVRAFFLGPLHRHPVTSVWPGKITTALQFGTLLLLVQGTPLPLFLWFIYMGLGALFFLELIKKRPV